MNTILSGRANFYLALTKFKQYVKKGHNDISLHAFAIQEQDGTQLFIEVRHVSGTNYSYRSDIYDRCSYVSTHIVCVDIETFLLPPQVKITQVRLFQGSRCIDRWACVAMKEPSPV
jgi:hypothetical protein